MNDISERQREAARYLGVSKEDAHRIPATIVDAIVDDDLGAVSPDMVDQGFLDLPVEDQEAVLRFRKVLSAFPSQHTREENV